MKICVIGTGYVGLVAGTCFAESGNDVLCVDNVAAKIEALRQGHVPIYEPGLEELIRRNVNEARLAFSTDLADAVKKSLVCFIAVGTPSGADGAADLSAVMAVAAAIGRARDGSRGIVAKGTAPIGTAGRSQGAVGADVDQVRRGIGYDRRIGHHFLFPGVGYGGSCFPKDVKAVIHSAREHGMEFALLNAVEDVNEGQKGRLVEKVVAEFGPDLRGRRFAVWGLAFKPRTDDMREAPAITIVEGLLARGAAIAVHDPEALNEARKVFGERVTYQRVNYEALAGADALLIVTEWNEFRRPDFARMKRLLRRPIIFDGRNLYDPEVMREHGFTYLPIGRAAVRAA